MNYLHLLCAIWIVNPVPVHAAALSNCHTNCFEAKADCNATSSHSFNNCHHALSACKMSCNSGKPHKTYHPHALIEMKFDPFFEKDVV
jgi:hypothetical protein